VDGLRNYPDEPEQRWYSDRYRSEDDDRYDGYRVPDPRYEEPRGWGLETSSPPVTPEADRYRTQPLDRGALHQSGPLGSPAAPMPSPAPPSLGPPMSTPPSGTPLSAPPLSAPPTSGAPGSPGPIHAAPAVAAQPGGAVYRARRAGVAALLAAAAVLAEILLVRVLLVAEFSSKGTPGGVLAGLFGLAGVPMVAMGLYGLVTGAASAGPAPARLWLRLPLAYLPVGLILLIAAALAVQ
jgi:hypothetical protein